MTRKEAKPILVISIGKFITQKEIAEFYQRIEKMGMGDDYYILIVPSAKEETEVNVFFERTFNEIKYQELKAYITKRMPVNRYQKAKLGKAPELKLCVISGCNNIAVGEEKTFCSEHLSFWDKAAEDNSPKS